MRVSAGKSKWNHYVLAIVFAGAASSAMANTPDQAEAHDFLANWLLTQGYECPTFEVSDAGVPRGADAATFCKGKACVIRIRPKSLQASIASTRTEGTSLRQWQNLLLHEAVHYIDILRRGRSDHGPVFQRLVRDFGITYKRQ